MLPTALQKHQSSYLSELIHLHVVDFIFKFRSHKI